MTVTRASPPSPAERSSFETRSCSMGSHQLPGTDEARARMRGRVRRRAKVWVTVARDAQRGDRATVNQQALLAHACGKVALTSGGHSHTQAKHTCEVAHVELDQHMAEVVQKTIMHHHAGVEMTHIRRVGPSWRARHRGTETR